MQGRLVELYCDEVKQHKLDGLRAELEEGSVKYLKEKADTLRWMMKEEKELGMAPTVTESDIEECLEKAGEMEERVKERREGRQKDNYYIFEEDVKQEKHKVVTN